MPLALKIKERDKNPCAACEFERSSLCHHRVNNKPPRPRPSQLRALPFNRYEPAPLLHFKTSTRQVHVMIKPFPRASFSNMERRAKVRQTQPNSLTFMLFFFCFFFNISAVYTLLTHAHSLSPSRTHTRARTQDVTCALFPINSCKNGSLDRVHTARKVRLSPLPSPLSSLLRSNRSASAAT